MTKPSILRFAPVAVLLALLPLTLPGQEEKPPGAQGEAEKLPNAAKPVTLQAALPVAEKAFAKEGVNANEYMLSKAIYLGDARVAGSGHTSAPALQPLFLFAQLNNVKLPAWVFTYTMVAEHDINDNTAYAKSVIIFVGPNNQASVIGEAPTPSE